jgi:hypothetical protein
VRFDVLKHEQFEEICAAAAIGQASPAELAELEQHASECSGCRQVYSDYLDLVARQFAGAQDHPELSPQEAEGCLNSEMFARRFFERAEREGIVFSQDVAKDSPKIAPVSLSPRRRPVWRIPVFVTAVAAAMVITIFGVHFTQQGRLQAIWADSHLLRQEKTLPVVSVRDLDQRLADLRAVNLKLESQVQQLAADLRYADDQLSKSGIDLKSASQDRQRLAFERDALAARLRDLQEKLAESETVAATAQQQLVQFRNRTDALQASLVADQTGIQQLTDQLTEKSGALDRERQLLVLGHDVNDLMGARNLHIVDVVDTDQRGKNRPAFGRIFFTEGKSLIFYAYDLNETKIEKARYQYRVWAKREGQDPRVQNLGIFYSDDKAQRRWVFKCNDPRILNEIDSVFVTLEPANSDAEHPKGSNLMYAYLRGQPNHP